MPFALPMSEEEIMKTRASIGLATAVALALALLAPAVLQGQKAKPVKPTPPSSISVDVTLDNSEGNMIRADNQTASYGANVFPQLRADTTDVYDYYLAFWFRYDAIDPANRSVVFDFTSPRYAGGDQLKCYPTQYYRQDAAIVPHMFTVPTFLTTGFTDASEEPLWVGIYTGDEWAKDGNGVWGSLGHFPDLASYLTGPTPVGPRYVDLMVMFRTAELVGQDAYAYLAYNGPIKTPDSFGSTRGLAEVTPLDGGGFVLTPLSVESLSDSTLPTAFIYPYSSPKIPFSSATGANQANLTIKIPLGAAAGFKAWYANCNVGVFNMPFKMIVTRK
jgi:hypothetical protein